MKSKIVQHLLFIAVLFCASPLKAQKSDSTWSKTPANEFLNVYNDTGNHSISKVITKMLLDEKINWIDYLPKPEALRKAVFSNASSIMDNISYTLEEIVGTDSSGTYSQTAIIPDTYDNRIEFFAIQDRAYASFKASIDIGCDSITAGKKTNAWKDIIRKAFPEDVATFTEETTKLGHSISLTHIFREEERIIKRTWILSLDNTKVKGKYEVELTLEEDD